MTVWGGAMEWMSCKELAAATGHSYEAVRKALRNAHDAPQPRTVRGRLLEWPAELTLEWLGRRRWHKPHDGIPSVCTFPGCERPQWAHGECAVHYGRRLKGRPGNGEEQRLGKPDGAGIFGVLDENDEGVLCHECGKRFRSLGNHTVMAHDLTAAEYKDKHGIPRKKSLASRAFRENVSARSSKPEALARFARARWASPPVATQDFRDALSRSQRARYAGY